MRKLLIWVFILALPGPFASCNDNQTIATVEKTTHEDDHGNGNTTTFTAEQIQSIGIELGNIENKQLTASLKANGLLQVPNQNKASVNSLYSGVIRSLTVQPGNTVTKGQVIATVTNPDFIRAQEDYLSTNARMALAEQEYNRQKELNQGNAGALKNLQAAEAELRATRTRKASLERQIELMGIKPASLSNDKLISVLAIRSPIAGVVSNVQVKMGSYVDVSTTVAEIVDNSQLHLDLYVYEKDLPQLKNNQIIHFTLTNNPGKEYDAEIYSLGSSFEGQSKAVTVHAKVKGDKTGLIDGMSITAVISLNQDNVPAVPSDAIVTHQGQDYIFVVSDGDEAEDIHSHKGSDEHAERSQEPGKPTSSGAPSVMYEKIPVAKGTTDVGYTEITLLKQIPRNVKIVTKGAFFILAKMTNTGEEEHGH